MSTKYRKNTTTERHRYFISFSLYFVLFIANDFLDNRLYVFLYFFIFFFASYNIKTMRQQLFRTRWSECLEVYILWQDALLVSYIGKLMRLLLFIWSFILSNFDKLFWLPSMLSGDRSKMDSHRLNWLFDCAVNFVCYLLGWLGTKKREREKENIPSVQAISANFLTLYVCESDAYSEQSAPL